MKKLNVSELNVLSNVIREKINDVKCKRVKGKLEKDSDYKRMVKLKSEINELELKKIKLSKESNDIQDKLRGKFGKDIYFGVDRNSEIKIYFNDYNNNGVYNDLVMLSIGKEVDIENVINKLVEKYSG